MELWFFLSIKDKRKLARYYRKKGYGFFIPPGSKKKSVQIETKLEDLTEIDKLMRQKPSGRMGRA